MSNKTGSTTHDQSSFDEDLEKILTKSFEDIRKKVTSLMAKREKRIAKEFKVTSKKRAVKAKAVESSIDSASE